MHKELQAVIDALTPKERKLYDEGLKDPRNKKYEAEYLHVFIAQYRRDLLEASTSKNGLMVCMEKRRESGKCVRCGVRPPIAGLNNRKKPWRTCAKCLEFRKRSIANARHHRKRAA